MIKSFTSAVDEQSYTAARIACSSDRQIMSLARELQRAAFWGRREYDDVFVPAPLYQMQAYVLSSVAATPLRHRVMDKLKEFKP